MADHPLPSSFRDPSGFLFERDHTLYRQINEVYAEDYDALMGSGLYQELVDTGSLIAHTETHAAAAQPDGAYKVIRPDPLSYVSYPYEWSFSQLKDAALTTLAIQRRALAHGLSLKDATAYNIQFHQGKPLLIDTLSFERYREGEPWVAYRQFCQHFLAPLALMAHRDVRLGQLLRVFIDGVPLDLCARLLPWRTRLVPSLLLHIHSHAAAQAHQADRAARPRPTSRRRVTRRGLTGILDSLEGGIRRLRWRPAGTEWVDYYAFTNYTEDALGQKGRMVDELITAAGPRTVWDLGANTGLFSRIAAAKGIPTLAFDIDPAAVERNYLECRRTAETHLLPLVLDLTNPSPGLGWAHRERMSLAQRGPADTVLALALIHHLAISNNVPLPRLAEFFHGLCRSLIIEFVPKSDSKVQILLATREDIFPDYHEERFRAAFGAWFEFITTLRIPESERTLYLLRAKAKEGGVR